MDERARRVGSNEALFRQVNEEIENLERPIAAIADGTLHIVCECGDLRCSERLSVPIRDYERVRAEPTLFLVLIGHEIPSVEDVVEASKNHYVVRKHGGAAEEVAKETDPRSSG
jgi:hypothetical protein